MDDDAIFRALADPSRRRLLDRLHAKNGQTLNELCDGTYDERPPDRLPPWCDEPAVYVLGR